jgi:hypothetical protein
MKDANGQAGTLFVTQKTLKDELNKFLPLLKELLL